MESEVEVFLIVSLGKEARNGPLDNVAGGKIMEGGLKRGEIEEYLAEFPDFMLIIRHPNEVGLVGLEVSNKVETLGDSKESSQMTVRCAINFHQSGIILAHPVGWGLLWGGEVCHRREKLGELARGLGVLLEGFVSPLEHD